MTSAGIPADARHLEWMAEAITEASGATASGDVPVGAVVVDPDGAVIGSGHNQREELADPTAHAEITALRRAAAHAGSWRLTGCTLVVTLEPCLMCAGAAMAARIGTLVLGAWDDKAGATGSVWDVVRDARSNHRIEVIPGIRQAECAGMLVDFFATRR